LPVGLQGKFFEKPLLNSQGVIECANAWNSANNQYDYWMDPNPPVEPLSPALIRYYTQCPAASPRLNAWLAQVTEGGTNQYDIARRIEIYLRRNFTYKIGAPALSRISALEDFLLDKREGHCERFASALALLLRMHNIPTRVAIGYVPGPQSRFSDWRQVRFKDAHSWTEAWFPDKGWVTFDATPGGGGGNDVGYGLTQLVESLDLVWYSHVISFDGATQREMLSSVRAGLMSVPEFLRNNLTVVSLIVVIAAAPLVLRRGNALRLSKKVAKGNAIVPDADHFYAELLRTLARRGIQRGVDETPIEFLERLRAGNVPCLAEIGEITRAFCEARYGEEALAPERVERLRGQLRAIAASKDFPTKSLARGGGDL
jgi:hypothetical protein